MIRIYHNPKCAKSREGLKWLEASGLEYEVINYISAPFSHEELKSLIEMLAVSPLELIRKKEDLYLKEYKGKSLSDDEWIGIMASNPRLIERPIVVNGGRAVIARPPEKIKDIL